MDYLDESKNYGETPFIPLETYRELMGISEGQYARFKDLSLYVIRIPVEEINRVTDFRVALDYRRVHRKVTGVKFKVRRVFEMPVTAVTPTLPLFPARGHAGSGTGVKNRGAFHRGRLGNLAGI